MRIATPSQQPSPHDKATDRMSVVQKKRRPGGERAAIPPGHHRGRLGHGCHSLADPFELDAARRMLLFFQLTLSAFGSWDVQPVWRYQSIERSTHQIELIGATVANPRSAISRRADIDSGFGELSLDSVASFGRLAVGVEHSSHSLTPAIVV